MCLVVFDDLVLWVFGWWCVVFVYDFLVVELFVEIEDVYVELYLVVVVVWNDVFWYFLVVFMVFYFDVVDLIVSEDLEIVGCCEVLVVVG